MSDQQPPTGGPGGIPDDDRPAPLIPSRAARHQAKRGLLRGRPNRPPRPAPEAPERPPPEPSGRERQRPWARERPEPSGRDGQRPAGRERQGPRVRPVPDLPAGEPSEIPPREDPRRRPALKAPQLRPPRPADLRGSTLGLAGSLVVVAAVLVLAVNALPSARPPATPAAAEPYSARWVCPLLPGQATAVTIANVGEATASLRTLVRETGTESKPATRELAGGATQKLSLKPQKAGFVQVEAFSAPVVVSAPGLGCAPGPGNRWWLPASDTRFGSDTSVIIANPDNQPAVVDLVPHLTSGSIRPDDREVFV
ncbi:MAG TPA: hypothetical protein VHW42_08800, partial [Actinomycetes bacterium]|nr:hypothetical protein [Actinomycetes bacterium]